jgi:hypothetical protein
MSDIFEIFSSKVRKELEIKCSKDANYSQTSEYVSESAELDAKLSALGSCKKQLTDNFLKINPWLTADLNNNGEKSFFYGFIKSIFDSMSLPYVIPSDNTLCELARRYPVQHLLALQNDSTPSPDNIRSIFSGIKNEFGTQGQPNNITNTFNNLDNLDGASSKPSSWSVQALDVARFECNHPSLKDKVRFINIGSEEEPIWCIHDLSKGQVYVPASANLEASIFDPSIARIEIACENSAWHAVLFAKICIILIRLLVHCFSKTFLKECNLM